MFCSQLVLNLEKGGGLRLVTPPIQQGQGIMEYHIALFSLRDWNYRKYTRFNLQSFGYGYDIYFGNGSILDCQFYVENTN